MKQYSILIVDDMPENLDIVIDFLKESGLNFKILKAPNGKIACDIAEKKMPNLIITDWDMPVMNGVEAIKWLKNNEVTKDIPVIVMSGAMIQPVDVKTALEFGAVDYIRKPVDKIELIARVNSMLNLFESTNKIKLLYEELRATNEQLYSQQEELRAILSKLKETQSQLVQSEKMASMGVLMAGLTHEINNPLNYIMGGETVLKMYIRENLNNYFDDILPNAGND
ncbi:MAG: response regulator [Chloroflexia bacterium]|nr:response regulator [Chloroflexia bacterium]